jgi:4-alpha-glucanotransferase
MAESQTKTTNDLRPPIIHPRNRASGILLHPTSLPGAGGVGDLGAGAYRFVDFLEAAKQTLWQIMPLGPVGMGNSPYAARSAFAGNPLLISLEQLVSRGWLDQSALAEAPDGPPDRVDYEGASAYKRAALEAAHERFKADASVDEQARLDLFREQQRFWLSDFALFMALKEARGGSAWFQWERKLVQRQPDALEAARRELADEVMVQEFTQYLFFQQWQAIRQYAAERGIRIVGDIPIFVAHDSADVWVHQELYFLDEHGQPTVVAGVPPDAFSETGQRWGNPLYRWDRLAARGYDWWIDRFRGTLQLVDVIRLDHFRGFVAYWEVPAEHETAELGRWVKGPGAELFRAVEARLGRVPMIVEDLGLITQEVEELRDELNYPGMKVLQFAFGDDALNPYLPHNYEQDCVVYTGTHDNDTTVGWFAEQSEAIRHQLRLYLGTSGEDVAWDCIRLALASVADNAIVPLQDVLALDNSARMNHPGLADGNWAWRYYRGQLHREHANRLAGLTEIFGRAPLTPEDEDEPESGSAQATTVKDEPST